jgi:hypothetical protein
MHALFILYLSPVIYFIMKRSFFKTLALINQHFLPSLTARRVDLAKAKKWQLALIAYRYWVTTNALD